MAEPQPAIACQHLVKRYGAVTALAGLDLSVPAGSIFGFLGPNGAGKTTTLRILTGLAEPTSGRALIAGQDVRQGGAALRREIGYLEQQPQLYGWMRARELLAFAGELFGLRGAPLGARVDELLELTGLQAAANRRVGGFSGGMRQRLGLAQALINRPPVLLLDEPVSQLDPAGRHDLLRIIAGLRGQATVLMSTHILADVERVCDRVAIIDQGRLVVEAPVAELERRYAQPVFVLEPEAGQEPQVEALVSALEQQPWVTSVTREGAAIRVTSGEPETASRAILPLVVSAGVALARFERARASLEDIFLRLVGEGGQEQAPSEEAAR
ncbi:MAG TPA: ABC transporter ATP-binding protein [Thermomicrobiaceae bacterium]|nr:ABC transporter ATP-binding protein [Thermomicrobiaceae bacterium]